MTFPNGCPDLGAVVVVKALLPITKLSCHGMLYMSGAERERGTGWEPC